MNMTRRMIRSEVTWAVSILAISAILFAATGRASMWNLAGGYIIVRSMILAARYG